MNIRTVSVHQVHQLWPQVEVFIESALAYSNDYTIGQARALLGQGYWHLIVAEENGEIHGACAASFQDRANNRVAFIYAIGGKMIVNDAVLADLEDIFRKCGATLIECAARPSSARLFSKVGMREKYMILEKEL